MRLYPLILLILLLFLILPHTPASARDATDRFRTELWYLDNISAPSAWDIETGSEQVIVAVLDAGFDLDHEDLAGRYWRNADEVASNKTDNDRNGYEDDVAGWDFVDDDPDPSPDIVPGGRDTIASHGTVVAGIIGATANNGLGIAGINWDVTLMPLRVLDENGAGSTADVRRAIEYAVENGADVINLSFTFAQTDERLRDTIVWAHEQGVVIVAAVGNGNLDTDISPVYPACFDQELGRNIVIGVASTDQLDQKTDFSNFGTRCTDVTAPGVDIFGAVYHDQSQLAFVTSYASPWEGTSLSAPMVAGAAALLRARYPSITPDQVRNALKLAVDPVAETSLEARLRLGAGRLNVARALEYAAVFAGAGISRAQSAVAPPESFVVAQGAGASPTVRRVNGRGEILAEFDAYSPLFTGGVRLAMGDVDGDGAVEIVTGAGPGGGPQVRIFDLDGNVEGQFFAFEPGDRLGIFVAAGDVNGDGIDEIVVSQGEGGTGQVRIFNRHGHLKGAFFPLGRTGGGVRVALANIDDDPERELVLTSDTDGRGRVILHDGTGRYIGSFTALGGRVAGMTLAATDIDGDGIDEIVTAAGGGYSPQVSVYNQKGTLIRSFFAFPHEFRGGVEIAVGDIDGNGLLELYVTATRGGPQVRIFNHEGALIGSFFVFDEANRFGAEVGIR